MYKFSLVGFYLFLQSINYIYSLNLYKFSKQIKHPYINIYTNKSIHIHIHKHIYMNNHFGILYKYINKKLIIFHGMPARA